MVRSAVRHRTDLKNLGFPLIFGSMTLPLINHIYIIVTQRLLLCTCQHVAPPLIIDWFSLWL